MTFDFINTLWIIFTMLLVHFRPWFYNYIIMISLIFGLVDLILSVFEYVFNLWEINNILKYAVFYSTSFL